ncbi:extracellular solute-binding protein [Actinoallomurus purpureus]|uniref:ABC transporter substrate-binding protein n=1 Tax=Actinoallomurus purpureus TaxID=478114 RepID=UPI00209347EB|nr:extracellular solute-binding protein [Actinoallomurus purpureus]MCO6010334.1 extracellular solute-binding protein [Actinoallomurus purpureus]
MFKATKALAALTAGMLALSACGGGGGGSSSKELKLWHYETQDSAMGVAWNQAIKEFEQTHPGVKVKFEEKGFEQIQKTAPMVLNSKDAPDILEYNKGNATAGLLSKQGLLTDISSEVTKRGWDKQLPAGVAETAKYDAKGVMGGDKWYGVPNYAEYLQVYYNKALFDKYGVKVPTTFDEFTKAMDTFAGKGVTPLANAGAEYPAQQYLYQLALSKADRPWVDRFERYTGKTDFHDQAWTYAATTFADWAKKGYVAKNSVGVKAEDAGTSFMSGKYPMFFSGSWWYGRFEKEIKNFQWDTFLWPGSKMTLGSSGNLWVVPKGSKNKDLAYDFINITMKKDIQNLLANNGGVPVAGDPAGVTDPKNKKLIQNYQTLAGNDGLGYYPDWPAPGYYDVLVAGTQKLINGTASPSSVLDGFAKPYNENLSNIGH